MFKDPSFAQISAFKLLWLVTRMSAMAGFDSSINERKLTLSAGGMRSVSPFQYDVRIAVLDLCYGEARPSFVLFVIHIAIGICPDHVYNLAP